MNNKGADGLLLRFSQIPEDRFSCVEAHMSTPDLPNSLNFGRERLLSSEEVRTSDVFKQLQDIHDGSAVAQW